MVPDLDGIPHLSGYKMHNELYFAAAPREPSQLYVFSDVDGIRLLLPL